MRATSSAHCFTGELCPRCTHLRRLWRPSVHSHVYYQTAVGRGDLAPTKHNCRSAIAMATSADAKGTSGPVQQQARSQDSPHLLIGPIEGCCAPSESATLLVLAPGAMQPAETYTALLQATQAQVKDTLQLSVGVVSIDWQGIFQSGEDKPTMTRIVMRDIEAGFEDIIDRAEASGYIMLRGKSRSGRCDRLFVAGHSAGGYNAASYALKRAGGLILLASCLDSSTSVWPSALPWTRPLLNLAGELDVQQRATRVAFAAVEAAESAAKFGLDYHAAFKPVVFLPGVTHLQFGSGAAGSDGVPSDVSHEEAIVSAADVIGSFLTAHCASDAAAKQAAVAELRRQVAESAELVAPYTAALGRGDPAALLAAVASSSGGCAARLPGAPPYVLAGGVLAGGVGGDMLRDTEDSRHLLAHPGEAAAAEAFAVAVQRRYVALLPPEAQERVRVVATVHTDLNTFIYNQPLLMPQPDGKMLLLAHVYLHREFLAEVFQPGKPLQVAPEYWLKLRTAAAIALALGLKKGSLEDEVLQASDVNQDTMQAALGRVVPRVRDRYSRRGKQLEFAPDSDVTQAEGSALGWVVEEHITFRDVAASQTEVVSPVLRTPAMEFRSYWEGGGRFSGNHYIKCVSEAACMEWIMLDGLKASKMKAAAAEGE